MTGAFTISIPGNKIAGTIGVFKPAHFMKPFFESVPCLFYHLEAATMEQTNFRSAKKFSSESDLKTHPVL